MFYLKVIKQLSNKDGLIVVMAHNCHFDRNKNLNRMKHQKLNWNECLIFKTRILFFDTITLFKYLHIANFSKNGKDSYSLEILSNALSSKYFNHHDALNDVKQIYKLCISKEAWKSNEKICEEVTERVKIIIDTGINEKSNIFVK